MRCQKCGRDLPEQLLDAKPKSLADVQATDEQLWVAADRGDDFAVLQCQTCYGPAWLEGE